MAPTHYLGDEETDWLTVELRAAEALRKALDYEGGQHIALDYPLILSNRQLRDPRYRTRILSGLTDLPEGYVWLRIGGFGADATGVGMSRYIEATRPLHDLGRPIIADQVGGHAGLAICAFGATSGYAHGIEGKQRSDMSDWLKPRKSGGGGRPKRIYLPGLDRSLEVSVVRHLFDDARTARQIFGCADTTCCGDIEKMLGNPEAHLMVQQSGAATSLLAAPQSLHIDQFKRHVDDRMKEAQRATRLKRMNDGLRRIVGQAAKRLERVDDALGGLHKREGQPDFALEAPLRTGQGPAFRAIREGQPS